MALNLNFGENDGPTVSADATRPPSIVGREPGVLGGLESPFRIRTKKQQRRMQKILGGVILSDGAPSSIAKSSKYINSDTKKASNSGTPAPEATQYNLKPVLSERRTRRLSLEANQACSPESMAENEHQPEELHGELAMKYEVIKSIDDADIINVELTESLHLQEPTREEIQEINEDGVIRCSADTHQEAGEEGQAPVDSLGATGAPCSKFLDLVVTNQRNSFARSKEGGVQN